MPKRPLFKRPFHFSTYFTPFKTHFLASIYDHPFSISSLVFIQNVRKKVMFLSVHCVCWCPILNRRNLAKERPILKGNWAASRILLNRQPDFRSSFRASTDLLFFPVHVPQSRTISILCRHNKNWKNQQIHWIFAAFSSESLTLKCCSKVIGFQNCNAQKSTEAIFHPSCTTECHKCPREKNTYAFY